MAKKREYYGYAEDTDLFNLVDKLEDIVICVDLQIERKKKLDRKQRQLPRGQLSTWNGDLETYADWKLCMQEMLVYDSERLNLSTLKSQIVGNQIPLILNLLYNVEDMADCFGNPLW